MIPRERDPLDWTAPHRPPPPRRLPPYSPFDLVVAMIVLAVVIPLLAHGLGLVMDFFRGTH